jgi:hypothetical protein
MNDKDFTFIPQETITFTSQEDIILKMVLNLIYKCPDMYSKDQIEYLVLKLN